MTIGNSAEEAAEAAVDAARDVNDHPAVRIGARLGYAASAVVHLLLGWLALKLAFGTSGGNADQSGALQQLAGHTVGKATLIACVIGFALLALWQLTEAVVVHETGTRLKCAGKAVLYAALAVSAFQFVRGHGTSSRSQTVDVTAKLMSQPMGRLLVALVGVAVIGVGGYHVIKGWKRRFLRDLQEHPGDWAVLAGRIGYALKGFALIIVGFLFISAALHDQAGEATGLDGALRVLLGVPFGQVLIAVVALGFVAFAAYSAARSKYARV